MMADQKLFLINIIIFGINLISIYYLMNLKHKADAHSENIQTLNGIVKENVEKMDDKLKEAFDELQKETKISIDESFKDTKKSFELINKAIDVHKATKATQLPQNPPKYDLSHLTQIGQYSMGPIQDDEALLLYGLVKVLRAKTVVEFGFAFGHSSFNFLKALDPDSKMFSFDIIRHNPNAESLKDQRLKFYLKSQTEFSPTDIDNRPIDIVYMDGGHILDIQTVAFEKIIKQMSKFGVIVVHDTGLHLGDVADCACDTPKLCGHMHQKDERVFINWILEKYPEYQVINLHSFEVWRHGLTFIQRKSNLSTETVDSKFCKKLN